MQSMNPTAIESDVGVPMRCSRDGEPTWEIALLFPRQGQWTEEEYLALDTNRMVELSDGCLEFLPMPSLFHQYIMLFLLDALRAFVKDRDPRSVVPAPLPVRLWPGKLREPDIVYFRPERVTDVHRPPNGVDLAVEIVNPGAENRARDLDKKRREYAQTGIAEYWIVDPESQQITVLTLDGSAYREHGVFGKGGKASSVLLPGFAVDVDAAFAAGEKTPG